MKILYVTTVGSTMGFFESFIGEQLKSGNTVDIATNENKFNVPEIYRNWNCKIYHMDFSRKPLKIGNIKSVRCIKHIVEENKYDIIHCHTPIAAFCTRLACHCISNLNAKVIYTAHGFHFFRGAPIKNWFLYYPMELLCSMWTDVLITINHEDFNFAQKHLLTSDVRYIEGVGVDISKFNIIEVNKDLKRTELKIPENATVLLSVGELNANKNHEIVIKAMADIGNKDLHYVIAGEGPLHGYLDSLADKTRMVENIHILGYRDDMPELYKLSDAFIHPSLREGLPVSIIEAMASGLPVICSNIRGNCDLVENNINGYLCDKNSVDDYAIAIEKIIKHQVNNNIKKNNICKSMNYSREVVNSKLEKVYLEITWKKV